MPLKFYKLKIISSTFCLLLIASKVVSVGISWERVLTRKSIVIGNVKITYCLKEVVRDESL